MLTLLRCINSHQKITVRRHLHIISNIISILLTLASVLITIYGVLILSSTSFIAFILYPYIKSETASLNLRGLTAHQSETGGQVGLYLICFGLALAFLFLVGYSITCLNKIKLYIYFAMAFATLLAPQFIILVVYLWDSRVMSDSVLANLNHSLVYYGPPKTLETVLWNGLMKWDTPCCGYNSILDFTASVVNPSGKVLPLCCGSDFVGDCLATSNFTVVGCLDKIEKLTYERVFLPITLFTCFFLLEVVQFFVVFFLIVRDDI